MSSSSISEYSEYEDGEFESSSSNDSHYHQHKDTIQSIHPMIDYSSNPQLPLTPGYVPLTSPPQQEPRQNYPLSPEMRRRLHTPQYYEVTKTESPEMYYDSQQSHSVSPEVRRRIQKPQHPQMMINQPQTSNHHRLDQHRIPPNIKPPVRRPVSESPERRRNGNRSNVPSVDSARNNLISMAEMSRVNPNRQDPWNRKGRSRSPRKSSSHETRYKTQYSDDGRSQSPERRYSHERRTTRLEESDVPPITQAGHNRNPMRHINQDGTPTTYQQNSILESIPTGFIRSPTRRNGRVSSSEKQYDRDRSPSRLEDSNNVVSTPTSHDRSAKRENSRDRSPSRLEDNSILGSTSANPNRNSTRVENVIPLIRKLTSDSKSPKKRDRREKSPKRVENDIPLIKKLTSDGKSPKKRDRREKSTKRGKNNNTLVSKLTSDSKSPKRRNSRDTSPERVKNSNTLVKKLTSDSKNPKKRNSNSRGRNNKQRNVRKEKKKGKKRRKNEKHKKKRSKSRDGGSDHSPVNGYDDRLRKVYDKNRFSDHDTYFERKKDERNYNSWDKRQESSPFECVEVGIDNEVSWYQGPCTGNPCGYSSDHSNSDCETFRTTKGHAPPRSTKSNCCCTGSIDVPPWVLAVGGLLVIIVSL